MKEFVIWDANTVVFKSMESETDARHWAINHLDQSLNPSVAEIKKRDGDVFTVPASLYALSLKDHFESAWVGEGGMAFRDKNYQDRRESALTAWNALSFEEQFLKTIDWLKANNKDTTSRHPENLTGREIQEIMGL